MNTWYLVPSRLCCYEFRTAAAAAAAALQLTISARDEMFVLCGCHSFFFHISYFDVLGFMQLVNLKLSHPEQQSG